MRRSPDSVDCLFSKSCHRVSWTQKYKYLRVKVQEKPVAILKDNLDLCLDKDNSVIAILIKTQESALTESDY